MKYIIDAHTHTVASGHAYSTIAENARYASEIGLQLIAMTDHAPKMPGSCGKLHFYNLNVIPKKLFDVEILKGVELNIMDKYGNVDLPNDILKKLDICIASLHIPCIEPMSKMDNTGAILGAMANENIKIIGHPGDPRYPFDVECVVREAINKGVLLEVNNTSLDPNNGRAGGEKVLLEMLKLCRKADYPIVLGSDSHFYSYVGGFARAEKLLEVADFPDELVINTSLSAFKKFIK